VEWATCRRCGTPLPLALREAAETRVHAQLPTRRPLTPNRAVVRIAPVVAPQTILVTAPADDTLLPRGAGALGRTGGADNLLPHGRAHRRRRWHW
jgi:hypothetical protein